MAFKKKKQKEIPTHILARKVEAKQITKGKKLKVMKPIIISVLILFVFSSVSFGQDLTGEDIIQKVNDIMNLETAWSKSKMTITTTSGKLRTFVSESWSKNRGEKNLVRYLEPSRVKDQAILMLNNADDIWAFFPATQRVRKLATHAKKQKMQGSDFSYEDMGSGDAFIDDYTSERLKDERKEKQECYQIELIRNPDSDLSYSRMVMWIVKENFVPIVIDYYEYNDPARLQKRLVASDIRIIDDIPTAMKFVMHNLNDNTQTEMELLEVKYSIPINDDLFTERNLKR